jgi:hypothetical protein
MTNSARMQAAIEAVDEALRLAPTAYSPEHVSGAIIAAFRAYEAMDKNPPPKWCGGQDDNTPRLRIAFARSGARIDVLDATPALINVVEAAMDFIDHCERCGGQAGGRGRIPGQRVPGVSIAPSVPCPQCGNIREALEGLRSM